VTRTAPSPDPAITAFTTSRGPSVRTAQAVLAGVLTLAIVIGLDVVGALAGTCALLLLIAVWTLTPSARQLSLRLAINGAIGLGIVPVLWWFPWPIAPVSHSGVILGLLAGFLSFNLVRSGESRRRLIPMTAWTDVLPAAAAVFCGWFFWSFVQFDRGTASVSLLRQAFGNDNVAHFDMFEMIRRSLTDGPNWPQSSTGSPFAYVTYPQHFHILVAFAAELWAGPTVRSVDVETGLFGVGSALIISIALVVLVAAGCSFFRSRFSLALIFSALVVFFLLAGFGGDALSYGFPGYLLAIVGTCIAITFAVRPKITSSLELLAIGSIVVLVAHSWSLLAPIAAVPFAFAVLRFPWRRNRARWRTLIVPVIVCAGCAAGVVYAAYLVFWATSASGSPEAALSTPGSSPTLEVYVSLAPVLAVLIGVFVVRRAKSHWTSPEVRRTSTPMMVVTLTALVESALLIGVQLLRAHELSYFQYKFLDAVFLIFAIALGLVLCVAIARFTELSSRVGVWASSVAVLMLVVAGVGVGSSFQYRDLSSLLSLRLDGMSFRAGLATAGAHPTASMERLVNAARVMGSLPCDRPVYVASLAGDQNLGASNQWALSLSSTWTLDTGTIDNALFPLDVEVQGTNVNPIIRTILDGHRTRCAIVAPEVLRTVSASVRATFGHRILSW
jgi:hypothetical protein